MIKYKLRCENCEKLFDSWFSSSLEYEKLKKKKFLNCHFCDSKEINKTLMSPNILNHKEKKVKKIKKEQDIRKKILEFKKFIKKNFEYVGNNFAYEARSLHYGEKKKSKGIYGNATKNRLVSYKRKVLILKYSHGLMIKIIKFF